MQLGRLINASKNKKNQMFLKICYAVQYCNFRSPETEMKSLLSIYYQTETTTTDTNDKILIMHVLRGIITHRGRHIVSPFVWKTNLQNICSHSLLICVIIKKSVKFDKVVF